MWWTQSRRDFTLAALLLVLTAALLPERGSASGGSSSRAGEHAATTKALQDWISSTDGVVVDGSIFDAKADEFGFVSFVSKTNLPSREVDDDELVLQRSPQS